VFADSANELNGRVAVLGIFAVMLIGAVVGGANGYVAVTFGMKRR